MDPNALTTPYQLTKGMHRDVYPTVDPSNTDLRVDGKVVLITGAGGGIGYAIAKAWSEAGAKGIILVGRDPKKLESTAADLDTASLVATGDVANSTDVQSIFEKAIGKFGTVDVVINSAGVMHSGLVGEMDPAEWWQDYEINVKGTYVLVHHFIKTNGGKGTFVNLTSLAASFVGPAMSSYTPSQLAVLKFAECVDAEHQDLRIFSIHPGIVQPDNGRGADHPPVMAFAHDKQALAAGFTLYLEQAKADYLRGGYVSVNWDVEEMEKHQDEIKDGKLLKLAFVNAKLGPEGHPWAKLE